MQALARFTQNWWKGLVRVVDCGSWLTGTPPFLCQVKCYENIFKKRAHNPTASEKRKMETFDHFWTETLRKKRKKITPSFLQEVLLSPSPLNKSYKAFQIHRAPMLYWGEGSGDNGRCWHTHIENFLIIGLLSTIAALITVNLIWRLWVGIH